MSRADWAGYKTLLRFIGILASSLAFLLVALLTCLAGYSLVARRLPTWEIAAGDLVPLFIYVLLLLPYYASRHGLLERKLPNPQRPIDIDSIRYGIELPSYIIMLVMMVAILFFGTDLYSPDASEDLRRIAFSYFLGLLPFLVVTIASLRNLASEDTAKAFRFSQRVLYPALCTGVVPFAYGWAIGRGTLDLSVIVAAASYVIAIIILSRLGSRYELWIVAGVIVTAAILLLTTHREEFEVITVGTLILLAMGVSEAGKRVHQAAIKDRVFPEGQGADYYLAGANWGSIVFLWLLPLVALLIPQLPTLPLLGFVFVQSFFWFFAGDNFKKTRRASLISLAFGYVLPLLIILTGVGELSPVFLPATATPEKAAVLAGLLIACIALVRRPDFSGLLGGLLNVATYADRKNTLQLFLLTVIVVNVICIFVGFLASDAVTKTKAAEIIVIGSLAGFILWGYSLYISRSSGNGE